MENVTKAVLEKMSISRSILSLLSYDFAVEELLIPVEIDEHGVLHLYMVDPTNVTAMQKVQLLTGKKVRSKKVSRDMLLPFLIKQYNQTDKNSEKEKPVQVGFTTTLTINWQSSIVQIVNDILWEAIKLRASDIHFEPFEKEMLVRFRVDGVLQEITTVPVSRVNELISRIKIMANLDIAEKRRTQDGKIAFKEQGKDIDIRLSILPTGFGEKAVMRLLDTDHLDFSLDKLGMTAHDMALFKKRIEQPNGIVLITGPTGSGKSTSLYGAINHIKRPGLNISTVEDPIEYNMPGINQSQVKPEIDMTFSNLLRSLLRQDPNVIMVGEMRDAETSEIAIRASLTGHLVLSTLHTNDAVSAITRLVDIGIEPYLVASSVTMIVAQRLVRRVCEHCKCIHEEEDRTEQLFGEHIPVYHGIGCSHCNHTGYVGRVGIFEVLEVSDAMKELINAGKYQGELKKQAQFEGLITLVESAQKLLKDGITSVDEVLKETVVTF